jgi:alpha-D-xyloside xylohydrolase
VNETRPDYDYADRVTFHVFELQDSVVSSARVPTIDGRVSMTVQVHRNGQDIHVHVQGASRTWSVLLRGIDAVGSVEGGTARADPMGTLLTPAEDAAQLIVRLSAA